MAIIQKVALENVRFSAYHGFYPEEQLTGNEFVVDIETSFKVHDDGGDELNNTVNYERLFEIASTEMRHTRKLLETVAHGILTQVSNEFAFLQTVKVSIRKMHLPVEGEVGNSLIQLTFNR